ncbi:MAG: hypothetical protein D6722_13955 [Bacteroidetes bacterium]|nr:MAG: hypothetical protein D6722_13955 [Bacteroidota bacterium]
MLSNFIVLQASRTLHLWDVLFGNPGRISKTDFDAIKTEAFIAGALLALICLGIAVLISQAIAYESGRNPRDPRKRRLVFIITGLIAVVALFAISSFSVTSLRGTQAEQFRTTMLISVAINALIYFVGGFALSKIFSKSKIGTWFPSK